jgi:predicted phage terminase large subunit-like protein
MNSVIDHSIRTSFLAFAMKAHAQLYLGKGLSPDPYVHYVARHLERVADGRTKRLVLALPPRHAKTFLGSISLAAWVLAQNPATKILLISYGQELADKIAYSIREILKSEWFRRLFKTKIAQDRRKIHDFVTTAGGGVRSVSIEGGVTGQGADLIIIDDPARIKDCDNVKQLEWIADTFDSEIMTRLDNPKKGTIIIVAHRLAKEDLPGHVLQQGGWKHIWLPLIAPRSRVHKIDDFVWNRQHGDLLRPDAFAIKNIEALRLSKHPGFETLQQQNPEARDRLRIKADHFGEFAPKMLPRDRATVLSIDPGQKGGFKNSFGIVQAWALHEGKFALLDEWRGQVSYRDFREAVRRFVRQYRPTAILIEATGNGPALLSDIRPQLGMEVIPVTPRDDKVTRLRRHRNTLRRGAVLLPEAAQWKDEFLEEIILFPYGAYDDQVDAMTQFLDWIALHPNLQKRPARAGGTGLSCSTGYPLPRSGLAPAMEIPGGVLALRRRW